MFQLFAHDRYYPEGGWSDYRGSFNTLDEAKKKAITLTKLNGEEINDLEAHIVRDGKFITVWDGKKWTDEFCRRCGIALGWGIYKDGKGCTYCNPMD